MSDCEECGRPFNWIGMSYAPHSDTYHAAIKRAYLRFTLRRLYQEMARRHGHTVTLRFAWPHRSWHECTCGWHGYRNALFQANPHEHLVQVGMRAQLELQGIIRRTNEMWRNVPVYPMSTATFEARRARELEERREWEERLRVWFSSALLFASSGCPEVAPVAVEGAPEGWRWANMIAFTEEEALNVALVRSYGCRCHLPLIGFRPDRTPRCRMCNTDREGKP